MKPMAPKFRIHLHDAHKQSGLSPWKIYKRTGIAVNTVRKYIEPKEIIADRIEGTLVALIEFYGLDWRDPSVIEVIEDPVD